AEHRDHACRRVVRARRAGRPPLPRGRHRPGDPAADAARPDVLRRRTRAQL
ncbi:MAG: hypothetical protein AVDCRST_MAG32-3029, partial [uncultured Nocardioides sp.]